MNLKLLPKVLSELKLPNTVEECHTLLTNLIKDFKTVIGQLEMTITKMNEEIVSLKERLSVNSNNSSLPPSKDYKKKKKKNNRPPSNRPSGGQSGHRGHFRALKDKSEVDSFVICDLPKGCLCGGEIVLQEGYQRHQVYELPEIKLQLTEYQLKKGRCNCCYQSRIADLPQGITWGITGPRLTSFMSLLVGKYQLSRRALQEFLKEHFQFSIALGTIFKKQRIVNQVLELPVLSLLPEIKKSPSANIDETGHRQCGAPAWMWVIASTTAAYFTIVASRGKKFLKTMMSDFSNIAISDRYAVYNYFDSSRRQMCWAHLKRDFTRLSEKEDAAIARIGKSLLKIESELFILWYCFKEGKITRDQLIWRCESLRRQAGNELEKSSYTDQKLKAARFCKNLLENFNALWTFVSVENVEPTNNHAERCLRSSVIWRKKYFGTRSNYGSEYVARCASWITTCKLQSKSAFEYLSLAIASHFNAATPPPLTG